MKHLLIAGLVWGFAVSTSYATPPDVVVIDEVLLGENEASFAVLRTERDNLGSYYNSRTKVFLDERSKTSGKSKEVLLSDLTRKIDPNHEDPNTPAKVTVEPHKKDDKVLLGELLSRYELINEPWPEAEPEPGTAKPKPFMGLQADAATGVFYGPKLPVFEAATLSKDVFGGRMAEVPVKIQAIRQEGTAIYLKLYKDDRDEGGGQEAHWVSVPPDKAVQIKAWQTLEPVYLAAGTFDSKEKAIEAAEKWLKLAQAKQVGAFTPEIWTTSPKKGVTKYVVVQRGSGELTGTDTAKQIEEAIGVKFEKVKSEGFREWVKVPSVY